MSSSLRDDQETQRYDAYGDLINHEARWEELEEKNDSPTGLSKEEFAELQDLRNA